MSVNRVDPSTGDLTLIAGGTLYADLPLLSWIKYDNQTNLPSGFLKAGDTISQSLYPEAYAKYGSIVPYKADTSELSDYEQFTISTSSSSQTTVPYDGIITVMNASGSQRSVFLNDVEYQIYSASGLSPQITLSVKKGDKIYINGSMYNGTARFYKKSLILKAKQSALPADFNKELDGKLTVTPLEKDVDLNTLTSVGFYRVGFSYSPYIYDPITDLHYPVEKWGSILTVIDTTSYFSKQVFFNDSDNDMYMRTKVNGAWSEWIRIGQDIYSTTETLTNKVWIDGKPIYRKVFTNTLPTVTEGTAQTVVLGDITNLDELISINSSVKESANVQYAFVQNYRTWSNTGTIRVFYNKNMNGLCAENSSSAFNGLGIKVIAEYTKTV